MSCRFAKIVLSASANPNESVRLSSAPLGQANGRTAIDVNGFAGAGAANESRSAEAAVSARTAISAVSYRSAGFLRSSVRTTSASSALPSGVASIGAGSSPRIASSVSDGDARGHGCRPVDYFVKHDPECEEVASLIDVPGPRSAPATCRRWFRGSGCGRWPRRDARII